MFTKRPAADAAWPPHWWRYTPALVPCLVAAGVLAATAPRVWLVLPVEGGLVAATLVAAAGWGAWPGVWLGLGRRNLLQQACCAIALGLGLLGGLALALGSLGWLSRASAWALVAIGGVLGLLRVRYWPRMSPAEPLPPPERPAAPFAAFLLLPLAAPLAVGVFGACLPPGFLWSAEAYGYDVLEYHLQVPREYYDAGRICSLPHNVYAAFPQQMEILYLLLMHLAGGPLPAAIAAQLLHAACGLLTVVALAAWTPTGWPRLVVIILSASVPWLAYLGCLAYVELGMLFFGAVATGLLLDHLRGNLESDWRTLLAAGLCAGWAAGCKYTAVALIAAAQALAWGLATRGNVATRGRRLGLFAIGCVVALGPWLVRNWAQTGNPVYPFAYKWFDGRHWSAEQAEQWARGHRLPPGQDGLAARARLLYKELIGSPMFSPALFALAAVGLLAGWSRRVGFLVLCGVLTVVIWAGFTHMPGRFVIPVMVPLALLAGRAAEAARLAGRPRWTLPTVVLVAVGGALWNGATLAGLLKQHTDWWAARGLPLSSLVGMTTEVAAAQPLRELLPADGLVKLVGEARVFYLPANVRYTVVFSRDPWLEYARAVPAVQAVAWLRTQNFTHVVFSWPEIERLRRSYGFPAWVTREWVAALASAGLRRTHPAPADPPGELEVYEVTAQP